MKTSLLVASLFASLTASSAWAQGFRMAVLDVGQGDAIVVQAPSGCTALFDGGPSGEADTIKAYLKSIGVTRIDFAVVSHYHADHIGSIDEIDVGTDAVQIDRVYDRGGSYSTVAYETYASHFAGKRVTVNRGDVISLCNEVRVEIVAVNGNGLSTTNENGLSVVAKVSYGQLDALIGGDATATSPSLEGTFAADVGPIELYKVHHHGSKTSSGATLLDAMMPTVSLISLSYNNTYGHPHAETIDALKSRNSEIWQTEDVAAARALGHIVVSSATGSSFTVSQGSQSSSHTSKGAVEDVEPPTAPSGLVATAASSSQVDLSWNASTDDTGVTGYTVFRSVDGLNYSAVGSTSQTSFADTSVAAATSYWYQVTAQDGAGNTSGGSAAATVTTPASTDASPPSVAITSPASGSTVSGTVSISASASDDVGVSKVEFYAGTGFVGSDASAPYSSSWNTSSVVDGTHRLTAKAYDAAGNVATSADVSVTVSNDTACGSTSQLLANAGFEDGDVVWTATSGVIQTGTVGAAPRTGSWKALLNGKGVSSSHVLWQEFTIPADACDASFSFWMRITTKENKSARDKLTLTVRDTAQNVLATLGTYSNTNKSTSYVQRTFDLSAFKGQTVRIYFRGIEDGARQTSFIVDDTAVTVTR